MALLKSTLESNLTSGPVADPCPESAADAAAKWSSAIAGYFGAITAPPVSAGVAALASAMTTGLASSMAVTPTDSTDPATTFAPVDTFIAAVAALASALPSTTSPSGLASYSGTFGSYAFSDVLDEDTASEAASKIASNVHNHITNIDNCDYTPTGTTTALVWA